MSNNNLPKAYAHCAAGCLWETVHRSEVGEWASQVREILTDGTAYLQARKEYKIVPKKLNGKIYISLEVRYIGSVSFSDYEGTEQSLSLTIPPIDEYAESIVFRFLDISFDSVKSTFTVIYEIAGVRYREERILDYGRFISFVEERPVIVSGAVELFQLNSGMTIAVEGEKVFIRYSADADPYGAEATDYWQEGQNYIGIATGLTAPTHKMDYQWILFSVGDISSALDGILAIQSELISKE